MVAAEDVGCSLRCQGIGGSNAYRYSKGRTKPPISALLYPFFILSL